MNSKGLNTFIIITTIISVVAGLYQAVETYNLRKKIEKLESK